jgi:enediyne biosynthesis protein E4
MARLSRRGVLVLLFVGVTLLLAVVFLPTVKNWLAGKEPAEQPREVFRERALPSGLTFRMNFLSGEQGERFKINLYDHGSGVAVGDYDGDGHDDIYFCNQLGENALYHNNGDGTFTDVTHQAGVALGDRVCVAATFVDYDNSGRQSLYVTSTRGGNVLFHNNGNGIFTDVTKKAGLTHVAHSQTAVFFDYNNDGLLDLFLTNTAQWTSDTFDSPSRHWVGKEEFGGLIHSPKENNVLYHNNGNGTFTDVTAKAGLQGRGFAGDAVAFDYDGDGYLDLFVTCMFGRCQLYHNNRGATFTDVTLDVLGKTPWGGVGARAFDLDNSGRLSLFAVDMHSDMWMGLDRDHKSLTTALASGNKKYPSLYGPRALQDPKLIENEKELGREAGFKQEEVLFGNACYRAEGGGKFTEVSDRAGLETFWPWGIAAGDFDNDGHEDLFLPSGMGYPFYYWPNQLRMNNGDGTFRERAEELGIEPPERGDFLEELIGGKQACRSSRSAAVADFDGDGRLDLVVNNFNDNPYYFRNNLPRKNYIAFHLRGTSWANKEKWAKTSRDAIGAVVRIYVGKEILTRQVSPAGGYLAQSSKTLHFGLGNRTRIDRVEITWPSSTTPEQVPDPKINQVNEVIEQP